MTELLQFNDSQVQPLDFTTVEPEMPETQKQYEYELQEAAGYDITADFEGLRNHLAQKHKDEEDAELYEVAEQRLRAGEDPVKVTQDLQNYRNTFNSTDADTSLEVEAGRNNAAKALQDNPATRINAFDEPATYNSDDFAVKDLLVERFKKTVEDYLTNGNKWAKYMGKAMTAAAGVAGVSLPQLKNIYENYTESLADFAANVTPFFSQAETASVGDAEGVELSALTTGERQKVNFLTHHLKDTPEQFDKYLAGLEAELDTVSPTTIKTVMDNLFGAIDTTNDIFNLVDTIDITGSIVGLGKVVKAGTKSEAVYSKVIGDITKADNIVADALEKGYKTPVIVEDAVAVSAAHPFQSQGLMSQSNRIAQTLEHIVTDKKLIEGLEQFGDTGKLSTDELEVAKDVVSKQVKEYLASVNNDFVDIQAVDVARDAQGAYKARLSIGGGLDGKIGMTKKAAEKLAKNLNLTPDEYTILKKDGQGYYIDVDRPLKEDELMVIGADLDPTETVNAFARAFGGTLNVSDKQHLKDITAFRQRIGLETFIRNRTAKYIKGLDDFQKQVLKRCYKLSQDGVGQWLSRDTVLELAHGDEAVWKAYRSYRWTSDLEYFLTNMKVRKDLLARNFKVLNNQLIVKPVKVTKANFNKLFIKNVDTYEQLEKQLQSGMQVVEVHRADAATKRLQYTHIVVNPSKDTFSELPQYVTPYQAGGRREYQAGTAFVKIGTTFREGVNGFARTLKAGLDKKALQEYADEVNKLIDIYKNGGDELSQTRAITDANFKYLNSVSNASEMKDLMRSDTNPKGLIDPNYRAQVLEDGDSYIFGNNNPSVYDGTERLHDALDDLVRMREESFSGRGVILDQLNGRHAKLADLSDIWDHTVRKASATNTLAELDKWYQREFRRVFGDYVKDSRFLTDEEILHVDLNNDFLTTDTTKLAAAKNFQQHYFRLMNAKTGTDKYLNRLLTSVANWAGDRGIIRRGGSVYRALAKSDPIAAVRTLEMYHVMGLNGSQLWKQPIDLISTALAHPIDAVRAIAVVGPALHALHFKRTNKAMFKAYKAYGKALGVDMERLVDFLDTYASAEMVGRMDPVLHKNSRSWIYNNVGKYITAPFQLGQGTVNVMSDIIAFLNKPTASFSEIAAHADDLTRNMTKVSESAFQYGQKIGLTKLASQWTGYQTHSLEALFNKRLTRRERVAMIASNFVLLGGISNFSKEKAANFYRHAMLNDDEFSPEMKEGIAYGLLHALFKEYDIDFNENLGWGDQIEKLIQLFDSEVDTNTKVADLIPAISGVGGTVSMFRHIKNFVRPHTTELDLYTAAKNFASDPNAPVGVKNLSRAYVMWKTGMYFNSRQRPIDEAGKPVEERTPAELTKIWLGLAPYQRFVNDFEYRLEDIRQGLMSDAYKECEELVQSIRAYKESTTEDPIKSEEELKRLYNKYDTVVKAQYHGFIDDYGIAMANEYYDKVRRLWTIQEAGERTHKAAEKYDPELFKFLTYGDK